MNDVKHPHDGEFFVPQRALVIVAHADDIEFGPVATIARWIQGGAHVTYCIVTDSSAGSDDPAITREMLAAIREREQRAAAAAIGVQEVLFLGYPDGMVENTMALRKHLVKVMRQVKPDLLLTTDPTMMFADGMDYINHPDHRAVAQAAIDAVFPGVGNRNYFPELMAEGFAPHKIQWIYLSFGAKPNYWVDISSTFDLKLEALRQHASQFKDFDEMAGWIRGWAEMGGQMAGLPMAESFRVLKIDG